MENNHSYTPEPGFLGRIKEFFQDNGRTLATAAIILLLIGAGIYAFNQDSPTQDPTNETEVAANGNNTEGETIYEGEANADEDTSSDASTEDSDANESDSNTNDEAPGETIYEGSPSDSENGSEEDTSETDDARTSYRMTATQGDGVTHLARRAIAQYLEEHPEEAEQITPAHKIYMETILTQKNYKTALELGETVTFSQSEVNDVVEDAIELPEEEVDNWQPYVSKVSSIGS